MEKRAPEQFLRQVQRDPLFAAEGMSLAGAAKALDALEAGSFEIEKAFGSVSFLHKLFLKRYPVASYVFPIRFLRAFIESERRRRDFLAAPSGANARRLVEQWRSTQRALQGCVRRYARLHRLLFLIEGKGTSFTYKDQRGNVTEFGDINRTLELLKENAAQLSREVDYYDVLRAGRAPEREVDDAPPLLFEVCRDEDVPPEYRRLHALEVADGLPFRNGDILEKYGPLRYNLVLTAGGAKEPHLFYAYLVKDRASGLPTLKISFADYFRFLPIAGKDARFGNVGKELFETLIERGIRYFYQPASNMYVSRDMRYWADLAAIVDSTRRSDLDMRLVWKQKSNMLDLIIGAAALEIQNFVALTHDRLKKGALGKFSAIFGVLIRSYPGLFYMPFNASVWRLSRQPEFLGSYPAKDKDFAYVDERVVSADTTPEEMKTIMKGGRIREEARGK